MAKAIIKNRNHWLRESSSIMPSDPIIMKLQVFCVGGHDARTFTQGSAARLAACLLAVLPQQGANAKSFSRFWEGGVTGRPYQAGGAVRGGLLALTRMANGARSAATSHSTPGSKRDTAQQEGLGAHLEVSRKRIKCENCGGRA